MVFENLPEQLHGSDPNFVPPFPGSIRKFLAKDSSFQRQHGRIEAFLAHRDGKVVGRIAAIFNHTSNTYQNESVGHFGFFACEDRQETANELFAVAEEAFRREGYTAGRGPYNPSIHDDCGVLVNGFDTPPMISMPHNPPHYDRLVQACGYVPRRELGAFIITAEARCPPRFRPILERTRRASNLKLRDIDLNNLDKELDAICQIYNQTLDRNWGFYPLTVDDLKDSADDMRFFADPRMMIFVEIDGEVQAFGIMLPNIFEFLRKSRGRKGLLRTLEVALRIKTGHPEDARLAILGVRPKYRDRALGALVYCEMFVRAHQLGYKRVETSWIDEDNEDILRAISLMGCTKYKGYRLYEKLL